YHRRVSRASRRASGLNSILIIVETAPEVLCGNRGGFSRIEVGGAAQGFRIPGRASSRVLDLVEARQECSSKVGPVAWSQAQRRRQDLLLCAHLGSVRLPPANRQGHLTSQSRGLKSLVGVRPRFCCLKGPARGA